MKRQDRWKSIRALRSKERHVCRRRRRAAARAKRSSLSSRSLFLPDERVITAPAQFALENRNHDPLVLFLHRLRQAMSHGTDPVCVDFRQTKQMVAGATLLFFSELHRLKEMYPGVPLRCIGPYDDTVAQVLQHLKIFSLFGQVSSVVPIRPDVINWRIASSDAVDGEKIGTLIQAFKSLDGLMAKHVFRGATEAMMNAMNHAYTQERGDGLPRPPAEKWWMFCRQDADKVVVAVCDLGMGIPKSLPLLYPEEYITRALAKFSGGLLRTDARMIEAAMEIQRTRTGKRGRGKGLKDIRRLVDEVPGGQLMLFSNRGLVKYATGTYTATNFHNSIRGTVVLWIIPLADKENE